MAWTIFGALRFPFKILSMYPLSAKSPVRLVISSSSHFCVFPRFKSSVFTHKPNGVNLHESTKIPPSVHLMLTSTS
nr:MAG TPA: hypothetical protein [Caudoviricetes sp.]